MGLDCRLYLVTDSTGFTKEEFLKRVEEACASGITLLQLREKDVCGRDYLNLAFEVKKISDKYNVPLIIDDRIDIALAVDAAGVHVGQSDINVRYARKLLGKDKIVGATTKTLEQAREAINEGADYLGVGAIYPTTTKVTTVITKVDILKEITEESSVPVVAIGGLNKDNCEILKGSGVSGIAVVSAIMKANNIKKEVEILNSMIDEF